VLTDHVQNDDEAWSRQRRIIAPALNERISSEVWNESVEQASSLVNLLLASCSASPVGSSASTIPGLRAIAMHVLGRIGYGQHKPFALPSSSRRPSMDMSYVDAIALCTENLISAAFIPASLLKLPFMPRLLQTLGNALTRLPSLTRDMLDQERQKAGATAPELGVIPTATPSSSRITIMGTLVRLSDQEKSRAEGEKTDQTTKRDRSSYLTEEEIAGNLFIFTAAGFDTTANTMSYAVTLLAVYPEWQTWIQTEIDSVLGGRAEMLDYAASFPKLTRCLAVMVSLSHTHHIFRADVRF
jgi:cytochrome P450